MKKAILLSFLTSFLFLIASSQLTTTPDGGNKKAMVSERVGITDITINYSRPGLKGREGKIWGQLVHTGYADLGFGSSKASPWRAGANENTTIEFSTDVKVEGQPLSAGKYGFFIAYGPEECTLIFSKNNSSWGSFFYDVKEDVLRVNVKPVAMDKSVEWLKYEFLDEAGDAATIALEWEKLMIPFKVEVDLDKLQLESFRRELRGERSFSPGWQSYYQAAQYTLDRNIDLEEGLKWADQAISDPFVGEANFLTLSVKASILSKLGRNNEADSIMKKAVPLGNMNQIHQYARQLLGEKKTKDALEVFKTNYQKYPDQFTTLVGLTRGYSANGDFKNALKYANLALPKAPGQQAKTQIEMMIQKLKENKDVN